MKLVLVGLNHRTAPVHIREQFTLSGSELAQALIALTAEAQPETGQRVQRTAISEVVILSTCNRFELYAAVSDMGTGYRAIETFLASRCEMTPTAMEGSFYRMQGRAVAAHLMQVACGLDSAILGEPQILGQVSVAFQEAQTGGSVGPALSHLFAQAIHAGKRARTETDISRYTTSISHAAVKLAQSHHPHMADARVLLVGAGDMARLAAMALQHHGVVHFACINRTPAHAQELAQKFGGEALAWGRLGEALAWADIVISATSAPHTVIHEDDLLPFLDVRQGRPLICVDVAVPRDIAPEVAALPGVLCYDVDHLQSALDDHLAHREAAVPAVKAIVVEEADALMEWLLGRRVADTVVDLRRHAKAVAEAEVTSALNRLEHLEAADREVVTRLAHRLVNKLLHEPTVRLKAQAAQGDGVAYAQIVRDLFGLADPSAVGPTIHASTPPAPSWTEAAGDD